MFSERNVEKHISTQWSSDFQCFFLKTLIDCVAPVFHGLCLTILKYNDQNPDVKHPRKVISPFKNSDVWSFGQILGGRLDREPSQHLFVSLKILFDS